MEKIIRGFLVDVYDPSKSDVVVFHDTLENIYKMLNVELIDVTERKIGEFTYDVVCDDEGLFKDPKYPSAFNGKGEPQLVGSLLLVNHDDEGNFASLTDEQIEELKKNLHVCMIADDKGLHFYGALNNVEYA